MLPPKDSTNWGWALGTFIRVAAIVIFLVTIFADVFIPAASSVSRKGHVVLGHLCELYGFVFFFGGLAVLLPADGNLSRWKWMQFFGRYSTLMRSSLWCVGWLALTIITILLSR